MPDNNKMLIDATHPEETRVVVLRAGRVEEFDYESAARKLLRGNIYLAKVTRVEPALQAAFVDYGGNRHGFLAFNEIHPDYYQIPVADRLALIEEEAAIEAEEEAEADARAERLEKRRTRPRRGERGRSGGATTSEASSDADGDGDDDDEADASGIDGDTAFAARDDDDSDGENPPSDDADMDDQERENAQTAASPHDAGAETTKPDVIEQPHASDTQTDVAETGDDIPEDSSSDDGSANDNGPKSIAQAMARDDVLKGEPGEEPEASDAPGDDASAKDAEPETGEPADDVSARAPSEDGDEASDDNDSEEADDSTDDADDNDENGDGDDGETNGDAPEEVVTDEADALEELPARPRRSRRSYKIQEVIKRRQVLLIQVVKEERGNKGAALTTYLSLAGRYTVLMPNTARGGGISRKITNPQDRKRLKAIANELEVPEGMGLIIRTAGAARTKQEIRRDFEYLLRLWESVRELTLQSTAPSLVYEEGDLIKRSIRDLYNKEIDEVIVAGHDAHTSAKGFMRMLMPSHAKNVTLYKDPEPLFTRFQIERQLNAMFSPHVTLKSGGYLVINQTEALVAVDVNSGRSTREFSIEETAHHTNLEAAEEIARQLKLRDLAGLIVIDFIDMEEKRNNRSVERRLKEALKHDRARIQVGRISHFGLMEMSRQRMRTGVLEGSTSQCPHCQGTGIIRSTESVALAVLRGLEDTVMGRSRGPLVATTTADVALYILNNKREFIVDMEARYGWSISVQASDKLAGANFTIEKGPATADAKPRRRADRGAVNMDWGFEDEDEPSKDTDETGEAAVSAESDRGDDEDGGRRKRRRRRGGRRSEGSDQHSAPEDGQDDEDADAAADSQAQDDGDADNEQHAETDEDGERRRRGRRRGRRGGRRNRERNGRDDDGIAADGTEASAPETVGGEADDRARGEVEAPGLGPQPSIANTITTVASGSTATTIEINDASDEPTADMANEASPTRRSSGRGRPRRKPKADDTDTAPDNATAAPHAEQDEPPPSAATNEASMPETTASGNTAGTQQADPANEPAAGEANNSGRPSPRPHHTPTSSKPRIERVSVGPDQDSGSIEEGGPEGSGGGGQAASDPAPTRRGWWQRRILGN